MSSEIDRTLDELIRLTSAYSQGRAVSAETHFVADLALSSLKVMNLMADVEDFFGIEIPLERLPDIRTVSDAARQVMEVLNRDAS